MTFEQRKARIMITKPFYGWLLSLFDVRAPLPGENVKTAAIKSDGTHILCDKFADTLTDRELVDVFRHNYQHYLLMNKELNKRE